MNRLASVELRRIRLAAAPRRTKSQLQEPSVAGGRRILKPGVRGLDVQARRKTRGVIIALKDSLALRGVVVVAATR